MTKMRESFEKWCDTPYHRELKRETFEAGWKAAIAAAKEGGPSLYVLVEPDGMNVETEDGHPLCWPTKGMGYESDYDRGCLDVALYKLEDAP